MEDQRTRNQARAAFDRAGLTYAALTPESMKLLRTLINERMKSSGYMRGTYRCRQRATVKQTPHGKYAEVRCKSDYFDDREAVSFNTDGFIGFAGWADDTNIEPVLSGFEAWVHEMAPLPSNAI